MKTEKYGSEIKAFRLIKGLTQSEFGNLFEPPASGNVVSKWERGASQPSPSRIIKLLELGVILK